MKRRLCSGWSRDKGRGAGRALLPFLLLSLPLGAASLRSAEPPVRSATPDAAVRAAAHYADNCAGCHGARGEGGRGPALFDAALLSARTDDALARAIREGAGDGAMPAFAGTLTEGEQRELVAFLRAGAAAPPAAPPFVADPHGQVVRGERQDFRVEVVARGLDTPWGLAFLPDGRLLVTERPGRLRVVEDGRLRAEPVRGLPRAWVRQDGGLMDVAVHPDHARNGWIYLSYSEVAAGEEGAPAPRSMTVVARGRLRGNEWVPGGEVFRAADRFYTAGNSHYGSRLAFDRTGHLFFSVGDRGLMKDAQDLGTPLGKIHRVRDDGTVPADNPFAGRAGAVPTIWSYGHRNPQGLAWDPASGLLWSSEHGPGGGDELNVVRRAANYGWGVATKGVQAGLTAREAPGMVDPVVHYTPRIAPSDIGFYDGRRYPGWRGHLFVAALAGQQLRRIEVDGDRVVAQEVVFDRFGRVRATAIGPDGLFHVLLQVPTGRGTGLLVSDPTPGMLVRLVPIPRLHAGR